MKSNELGLEDMKSEENNQFDKNLKDLSIPKSQMIDFGSPITRSTLFPETQSVPTDSK